MTSFRRNAPLLPANEAAAHRQGYIIAEHTGGQPNHAIYYRITHRYSSRLAKPIRNGIGQRHCTRISQQRLIKQPDLAALSAHFKSYNYFSCIRVNLAARDKAQRKLDMPGGTAEKGPTWNGWTSYAEKPIRRRRAGLRYRAGRSSKWPSAPLPPYPSSMAVSRLGGVLQRVRQGAIARADRASRFERGVSCRRGQRGTVGSELPWCRAGIAIRVQAIGRRRPDIQPLPRHPR